MESLHASTKYQSCHFILEVHPTSGNSRADLPKRAKAIILFMSHIMSGPKNQGSMFSIE